MDSWATGAPRCHRRARDSLSPRPVRRSEHSGNGRQSRVGRQPRPRLQRDRVECGRAHTGALFPRARLFGLIFCEIRIHTGTPTMSRVRKYDEVIDLAAAIAGPLGALWFLQRLTPGAPRGSSRRHVCSPPRCGTMAVTPTASTTTTATSSGRRSIGKLAKTVIPTHRDRPLRCLYCRRWVARVPGRPQVSGESAQSCARFFS